MMRIDPSEDLFVLSPRLANSLKAAAPSKLISSSSSSLTNIDAGQQSHELLTQNPINATLGFSLYNGNIARRCGKKMTVYQLLLDSQLELKSEGDKITCSKAGKKRKKLCMDSTTMVGDVHGPGRSPYITAMEIAINSGEPERIRKYFHDFCNPDSCSLQVDMNVFSSDGSIPIFRDIRGVNSIASYFVAYTTAMPDCIHLFWQKAVVKNPDGTKEIRGEHHSIAKRLYEINVLENEHVHEDLESAVFGLAALASGKADLDPNTVYCSTFPPYEDTDSTDGVTSAATDQDTKRDSEASASSAPTQPAVFAYNSRGERCKVRSLDSMNILVADSNVEFTLGGLLPEPVEWNNKCNLTWMVDTNHKVTRMRLTFVQLGNH